MRVPNSEVSHSRDNLLDNFGPVFLSQLNLLQRLKQKGENVGRFRPQLGEKQIINIIIN